MTSGREHLSDDRLVAELRRRAGDRAPAGLANAVVERVEETVQVRRGVLPLRWGRQLAAAAAVVVVGIGALVWLTFSRGFVSSVGGPSATPGPSAPATERAYTAQELATALTPSWAGEFVVVHGVLRAGPAPACPEPAASQGPNLACLWFRLDGLPGVTVTVGSDAGAAVVRGDTSNGTWVLRVTNRYSLALYGEVEPAADGLAWHEADVAALGFNGVRAPFSVVDGWLVGGPPIRCPAGTGPHGPVQTGGGVELSWGCGPQAWLTARSEAVIHRTGGGFSIAPPPDAMQVQTGAYGEFVSSPSTTADGDAVPEFGTWLVRDRRCGDSSSCATPGGWELVTRLDDASFAHGANLGAPPSEPPAATPIETPVTSSPTSPKPGSVTPAPSEPTDAERAYLFVQKFEDAMATGHGDTAWTFLAPGEQASLGSVSKLRAMYASLEPNGSRRYVVHQPAPDALQAGVSMDPTGTIRTTADLTHASLIMVDHPDAGGTSAGQTWLIVAPLTGTNDWRIWIVR